LRRFGIRFNLDIPAKPENWLSTEEICETLYGKGRNKLGFDRIFSRLQSMPDSSLMRDPIKGTRWQVRFFIVKGEPRLCLHGDDLESFSVCYRAFKSDYAPETPEWLSAQDLGDYLGTSNCQYIENLLEKFVPVKNDISANGKTEYMFDETKQWAWHIQTLYVNGVLTRYLHESQIEDFVAKYRLYNLRKKQFDASFAPLLEAAA
jgi:hypothetical protein